jgi:2,3-bisphosphoglycerate-dependent phosphoglycerate mutase
MRIEIVYETHATTEDNESGHATGWRPGRLSAAGRAQAAALGERRRADGIAAVFCSDLARAAETAEIAFGGSSIPVLLDWRLRECDYGTRNGMPVAELHAHRTEHLDLPYPGGESWRQATGRVGRFLADLPTRWDGQRVAVIGRSCGGSPTPVARSCQVGTPINAHFREAGAAAHLRRNPRALSRAGAVAARSPW